MPAADTRHGTVTISLDTLQAITGTAQPDTPATVTFISELPAGFVTALATGEVIRTGPVSVTVDASGDASVQLVATDDTSTSPFGWRYVVRIDDNLSNPAFVRIRVPGGQTSSLGALLSAGLTEAGNNLPATEATPTGSSTAPTPGIAVTDNGDGTLTISIP